jgi:hypothetical protein
MFEYFPGNYVWNLSVAIAIESGAQIGEIDEMCRPLREAAGRGEDERTGGVEHVSVDNMSYGRSYIADWIAETFGTHAG